MGALSAGADRSRFGSTLFADFIGDLAAAPIPNLTARRNEGQRPSAGGRLCRFGSALYGAATSYIHSGVQAAK